jgi:hypothetical protein
MNGLWLLHDLKKNGKGCVPIQSIFVTVWHTVDRWRDKGRQLKYSIYFFSITKTIAFYLGGRGQAVNLQK